MIPLIENKKVVAIAMDVLDISNEKKIAEDLSQSERRYKSLADSALEGIVIHQKGKVIEVNKATTQLFKYTEKEVIGKSVFKFIAKEHHRSIKDKLNNEEDNVYVMQMLRKGREKLASEIRAEN